jgi:NADH:ubiquinone oxidoreductase subunit 4 (subunit M)
MLLTLLLLIPIVGIFIISAYNSYEVSNLNIVPLKPRVFLPVIPMDGVFTKPAYNKDDVSNLNVKPVKIIALVTSIVNLFLSLIIFTLFDFSSNQFQFVQEYHEVSYFDFYLGLDGLSIYFVLLTTIITPIALLSN